MSIKIMGSNDYGIFEKPTEYDMGVFENGGKTHKIRLSHFHGENVWTC